MPKRLTKKQRGFINDVADGMVPTQAALKNYDTTDYQTAGSIAHENLNKPQILEALKELGFDSDNAKRVVAEILENGENDIARLQAAREIFKVNGDYAPEKHAHLVKDQRLPSNELLELAEQLAELQKHESRPDKRSTRTEA